MSGKFCETMDSALSGTTIPRLEVTRKTCQSVIMSELHQTLKRSSVIDGQLKVVDFCVAS